MLDYLLHYKRIKSFMYRGQAFYNYDLKKYSTFRIGGKAKIFVEVGTLEEIIKVYKYVTTHRLKYFVLGNGSNTLISSEGYRGVVIYFGDRYSSIEVQGNNISALSGAMIYDVYRVAKEHGLSGLEGTAGLPASVGGMVYMNASCFGFDTSKVVSNVLVLSSGKIREYAVSECGFGYRDSVFQHMSDVILLKVEFTLTASDIKTIKKTRLEVLDKRLAIQPKGNSCGCVFKRVEGIQVSKMLDDLGIKGKTSGKSFVSDKHANFIINKGNATSKDVINLILDIENAFYDRYGIRLHREIKYLGDEDEVIW